MESYLQEAQTLLELEQRHDDLLDRLDALDQQVQRVLREWTSAREQGSLDRRVA